MKSKNIFQKKLSSEIGKRKKTKTKFVTQDKTKNMYIASLKAYKKEN